MIDVSDRWNKEKTNINSIETKSIESSGTYFVFEFARSS